MSRPALSLIWLLSGAAILSGCASPPNPTPTVMPTTVPFPGGLIIDYGSMPFEQIINRSDSIFVGQVAAISNTRANQDSGEYWAGAQPVFTIEVDVLQPIVGAAALPLQLTITQVGYSPLEHGESASIEVGQRAVFFIVETEIAWRDGRRAVLRTTNTVPDSIIVIGGAGSAASPTQEAAKLDDIIREIAEQRAIVEGPEPVTADAP